MTDKTTETKPTSLGDMVANYFQLREKRSALKARYDEIDKSLKAEMAQLEGLFQAQLNQLNVNSLSGDNFVVFQQTQENFNIADEDAFYPWAAENDALDMFQKRLAAGNVKQYIENTGELPPGVNVFRKHNIRVNRK